MSELEKICDSCKEYKPLSDFYKRKDGYQYQCKKCQISRITEARKTEKGRINHNKNNKKYYSTEKGKLQRKKRTSEYNRNNPDKKKAHDAVADAIRGGRLKRARENDCVMCGEVADHYHHHMGYSVENKLNVIPLCVKCHIDEHR